jgi:hypothetical protein
MKEKKGLLTIGVGKKYAQDAKYLALSGILNSPHTLRAVITDFPELLAGYYDIVIPYTSNLGDPFSLKTRLATYTPFVNTLFVDADSLIISPIDPYWEFLSKQSFVYAGDLRTEGSWYFDISQIISKFKLTWLPQLNSGMFLFDNSMEAKSIFETASYYMENQENENITIDFFRGTSYPDEPFFSLALAKNKIKPINDYTRFSKTLIKASNIHLNVRKKIAYYTKDGRTVFPQIVHFCGKLGNIYYFREKLRLWIYFHF